MMFLSNSVRHRESFSNFAEKKVLDDEVQSEEENVEVFDESLTDESNSHTDVSRSSSSVSKCSITPTALQKKRKKEDPLDEVLAESLKAFREKRSAKEQAVSLPSGPAYHFGMEIAWRLHNMTPRQRALAQLRIQQVLYEMEFPPEHFMSPNVVQPYS